MDTYCEYIVKKKNGGKELALRALIVMAALALFVVFMLLGGVVRSFSMITTLLAFGSLYGGELFGGLVGGGLVGGGELGCGGGDELVYFFLSGLFGGGEEGGGLLFGGGLFVLEALLEVSECLLGVG